MTGADIHWPGVDRDRAVAACWHLTRAAQHAGGLRCTPFVEEYARTGFRIRTSNAAREHLRIANGYLGAVGYEHRVRV